MISFNCLEEEKMGLKRITYPRSPREIPVWRRRQITQDLLWFSKFSPAQRLQCIDREWDEIQAFISKFGLKKHGTRKRDLVGWIKRSGSTISKDMSEYRRLYQPGGSYFFTLVRKRSGRDVSGNIFSGMMRIGEGTWITFIIIR
jgi:hypothetical protein